MSLKKIDEIMNSTISLTNTNVYLKNTIELNNLK